MTERLRVGTRPSPLALAQTELVLRALRRTAPQVRFETVPLRTAGDRTHQATGTLDFTDEIDRRLGRGEIDLAVHSAKDLPATVARGLAVAAYPRRGDPRDCLILRRPGSLESLRERPRIGSSSLRRKAQLLAARPDAVVVPIRGNIGTRIRQIDELGLDGIVLAAAGVARLGESGRASAYLPVSRWLPAPGQGALAVEVRAGDRALRRLVAAVDHDPTRAAVEAERAVVATLGGDCNLPLGALARPSAGSLRIRAALYSPDGRVRCFAERSGPVSRSRSLGADLGRRLARIAGPAGLLPPRAKAP